jgi:hypothetical protein
LVHVVFVTDLIDRDESELDPTCKGILNPGESFEISWTRVPGALEFVDAPFVCRDTSFVGKILQSPVDGLDCGVLVEVQLKDGVRS